MTSFFTPSVMAATAYCQYMVLRKTYFTEPPLMSYLLGFLVSVRLPFFFYGER